MGVTVRQKPPDSGIWWIFISHNGRRRSKRIGPKREAKRIADEITRRLAAGDLGILKNEEKVRPFSFFCREWMQ